MASNTSPRREKESENLERVSSRLWPAVSGVFFLLVTSLLTTPVAASHETFACTPPNSLNPLLELLHTLTELAFLAGVGLGVLGFSIAGILLMVPGQQNSRRGKAVAKNSLFGVLLLLSANMVVGFLVNELGGVICS